MTRRKGESSARDNERRLPHRVAVPVPPGGFGRALDGMLALCHRLGGARGRGFREDDRDHAVWCFASADDAAVFARETGGRAL